MKRRQFIKQAAVGTAAAGSAAALAGLGASCRPAPTATASARPAGKTYRWDLCMIVPKTLPLWGPGVETFADNVRTLSGGRLDIKVYGAGELVPALQVFDAVQSGKAQMGHSAAYYWEGKIPASVFYTSVPFGMNANGMSAWINAGGGQELWDELYAPFNLKAFPCGNTGVQMGGWFNKEINSVDDYKGLKMRMPGLGGKTIAKAGAVPILLPGGEIYTSLDTGVIDATEWVGPYHDYVMGFHRAAKYYYSGGWHEPGSVLELLINRDAWESLPTDLQQIVQACAGQTDRDLFAQWMAKDSEYYQKILAEKRTEMREFPVEVTQQMRTYAAEVKQEIADSSPLATRIAESFTEFQRIYEAYQELSERAYVRALTS